MNIELEGEKYKLLGLGYELLMFSMRERCGGEVNLYSCPLSLLISQLRSVRPLTHSLNRMTCQMFTFSESSILVLVPTV